MTAPRKAAGLNRADLLAWVLMAAVLAALAIYSLGGGGEGSTAPGSAVSSSPAPTAPQGVYSRPLTGDRASRSYGRPTISASVPAPVPTRKAPTRVGSRSAGVHGESVAESRPVARVGAPSTVWQRIAKCESGGRLRAVGGPGGIYRGLYQIHVGWFKGAGLNPNTASAGQQLALAQKIQRKQGWGAWPVCAKRAGVL